MRNLTRDELYRVVRHILNHAQIQAHIAHLDDDVEAFEIYNGFCHSIYDIADQVEAGHES